ncbi:hypothetical protein KBD49_11665 [Myxococcota bacterium]|nr:hypothetical protein [Myxococcota bacterium]
MRGRIRIGVAWGLVGLLVLAGFGCGKRPRKAQKGAGNEGLTGGALVFSDDFERGELGDSWLQRTGRWRIVDGRVRVQGDRNEGLWLQVALPDRVRIEFDAVARTPEGDLKCEVFASEPRHQTGYIAILGGWKNSLSVLARLDEHGEDRLESPRKASPGQVHHFVLLRTGSTLAWYVDGEAVLSFADEAPLNGRYFGFNNWMAEVEFDNLAIYAL